MTHHPDGRHHLEADFKALRTSGGHVAAKSIRLRMTWNCDSNPARGRFALIGQALWMRWVTEFTSPSYSPFGSPNIGFELSVCSTRSLGLSASGNRMPFSLMAFCWRVYGSALFSRFRQTTVLTSGSWAR